MTAVVKTFDRLRPISRVMVANQTPVSQLIEDDNPSQEQLSRIDVLEADAERVADKTLVLLTLMRS